jgi:broad-specificity NMP kinase
MEKFKRQYLGDIMPYIKTDKRDKYYTGLTELGNVLADVPKEDLPGELNFVISSILNDNISYYHRVNYEYFNMVIGVLECVKQELYRRMLGPYEDIKIEENGDVYGNN